MWGMPRVTGVVTRRPRLPQRQPHVWELPRKKREETENMTNNIRVTVREHADDLFDGQDVTGDVSASAEALYDLFDGALCLSEETVPMFIPSFFLKFPIFLSIRSRSAVIPFS